MTSDEEALQAVNDRAVSALLSDGPDPPSCVVMGFFRHPDYPGTDVHRSCGYAWYDHGWIDGRDVTVCPSHWGPFPGQTAALAGHPEGESDS